MGDVGSAPTSLASIRRPMPSCAAQSLKRGRFASPIKSGREGMDLFRLSSEPRPRVRLRFPRRRSYSCLRKRIIRIMDNGLRVFPRRQRTIDQCTSLLSRLSGMSVCSALKTVSSPASSFHGAFVGLLLPPGNGFDPFLPFRAACRSGDARQRSRAYGAQSADCFTSACFSWQFCA